MLHTGSPLTLTLPGTSSIFISILLGSPKDESPVKKAHFSSIPSGLVSKHEESISFSFANSYSHLSNLLLIGKAPRTFFGELPI
jgi:hypothetical protein